MEPFYHVSTLPRFATSARLRRVCGTRELQAAAAIDYASVHGGFSESLQVQFSVGATQQLGSFIDH
jgi:hypothetical protein